MKIKQHTKTNGYEKVFVAIGKINNISVIGKGKTAYRALSAAFKSYQSKIN